jgi:hypothetical protein
MEENGLWPRLAALLEGRAVLVLAAALLLTGVFAYGTSRLQFKTTQDTLLSGESKVFQDNERYQEAFGGETLILLLEGENVLDLFREPDRSRLLVFQAKMAADPLVHSVISPLVALDLAVTQTQAQIDAVLKALAEGRPLDLGDRAADFARFQAVGEVSATNIEFVKFAVFDAQGAVRSEFRDLIPDERHALMVLRFAGNLPFDVQSEASARVRDAARALELERLSVLPTGPALLLKEINDQMRSNMVVMGLVSVAVMTVVLSLVFRARWRLLALPMVLMASVLAFGIAGYASLPLTLVAISALPILIGFGIDFSIQVHNRYEEARERGEAASLAATLSRVGLPLALAVVAAVGAFLALRLSEVPMVRDFSVILVIGTIAPFLAAVLLVGAALSLLDRDRPARPRRAAPARVDRIFATIARTSPSRALPLIAAALLLLVLGTLADRQLTIESDPESFLDQESQVLRDLQRIRDVSGSADELALLVEAADVRDPAILAWMSSFLDRQLERHKELVSGSSPGTLVREVLGRDAEDRQEAASVLASAPGAIRRTLITEDATKANLVFNVGRISLNDRERLVQAIEADLDAPQGVSVSPGGLAVVGVATVKALGENRTLMSIVAVGVTLVVLTVFFRNPVLGVVCLLPILSALGMSGVLLYLLGVKLSPLTAMSGPLIVATATELAVLMVSRYREERAAGHDPRDALNITSSRIGRAIFASGLTTIGGFGALMFADFPLLVNFGQVTALNMSLSLLSALIVLPPILLWLDEEVGLEFAGRGAEAR